MKKNNDKNVNQPTLVSLYVYATLVETNLRKPG